MPRSVLDHRRYVESFGMQFRNIPFDVSVGYFPGNSKPAEVFVSSVKSGCDLEAVARDAAVLMSVALQFGAPVDVLAGAITRTLQGEPQTVIGAILDRLASIEPIAVVIPTKTPKPPDPDAGALAGEATAPGPHSGGNEALTPQP